MNMKSIVGVLLALAFLVAHALAQACQPCAGWWDWEHRLDVCAAPSESLFLAEVDCLCAGAGAPYCAAWCFQYATLEADNDPSSPAPWDPSCDTAMALGGACHTEAAACGADRTGCVSCSSWLAGADPQGLCSPEAIDAAGGLYGLSNCACYGGCATDCASSCGLGYLAAASAECQACLQDPNAACAAAYTTCAAN